MAAPRITARYTTRDGREHTILVYRTPAGRWRVVDHDGDGAIIVETLTGFDDRLSQAQALAHDYAREQQAYHDGDRDTDPLPRLRPTGAEPPEPFLHAA
jgi:hypothetical protein